MLSVRSGRCLRLATAAALAALCVLAVAPAAFANPGDLDSGFGSGGKVLTGFAGTESDNAYALALQSDGKILAGGGGLGTDLGTCVSSASYWLLARYNTDGSLDQSFGSGGQSTSPVLCDGSGAQSEIQALAVQSDGKIIAVGLGNTSTKGSQLTVARYNSDGTLDSSFANSSGMPEGMEQITFGEGTSDATGVAIEGDGKLVVSGQYCDSTCEFLVVRLNSDGSLDEAFGSKGHVLTPGPTSGADASTEDGTLALQSDGKIIVGGIQSEGVTSSQGMLVRYNADGTLDSSFGSGGIVIDTQDYGIMGVALAQDGTIVTAGNLCSSNPNGFPLTAYAAGDGSLDSSFGSGGEACLGLANAAPGALALAPDGSFIVAGTMTSADASAQMMMVARVTANGTLDSTFGSGGDATTQFASGSFDQADAVVVQPDGKVVAAGGSSPSGEFALARYLGGTATAPTSHTLSISSAGSGSGTITSSPAGIICGSSCSHAFTAGTAVTLTAVAAAGSTFTGWSGGGCSGTGTCAVTLSADTAVTATFTKSGTTTSRAGTSARPNTRITSKKLNKKTRSVIFKFKAVGKASGFQCALVKQPAKSHPKSHHKKAKQPKPRFSGCRSPKGYKHLARGGRYVFYVRAVGPGGSDRTPARFSFKA